MSLTAEQAVGEIRRLMEADISYGEVTRGVLDVLDEVQASPAPSDDEREALAAVIHAAQAHQY